jgi:hypothetical protein
LGLFVAVLFVVTLLVACHSMTSRPRIFRSLRALIHQLPSGDETNQALRELSSNPDDRTVAIVGAALLESALQAALTFKLKKIGANRTSEIFRGDDAPFGSFSAKIKLARAINLLGDPARHDLDCIREVRNAFAQIRRTKLTFETVEIAAVCKRINFPIFGEDTVDEEGMSRWYFLSGTILYSRMLVEMATLGHHHFSKKQLGRSWRYK